MTSAQIAARLHAAVDDRLQLFTTVDQPRTAQCRGTGGCCAREIQS